VRGLEGSGVVVTGSSQGIGRAVALRLAREGASVVVNGTGADPDALPSLVDEVTAAGGRAVACAGSVADPAFVDELISTAVGELGAIHAVVNVAGIAEPQGSTVLTMSVEDWHRQIGVHLDATFYVCRAAVPHLVAAGGGAIVNTTSHAFTGMYGGTGYAAGKGGVNSLTYALAADLVEHGIRVNAVAPGARTRLSSGPEFEETIESLNRRGLLGDDMKAASLSVPDPEFVAPLYAYLVDERSAPITGRVFSASGMYVGEFDRPRERLLAFGEGQPPGGWTLDELERLIPPTGT
jgi:3-oxoacyl-[acyl-carrier protein] reductase